MYGTIYDFRSAAAPDRRRAAVPAGAPVVRRPDAVRPVRVAMVVNPRSRRHLPHLSRDIAGAEVRLCAPHTRAELRTALFGFAAQGVDLLVIDGGDGTVRDVLTCSEDAWGADWPAVAVLPSGKTNALAVDLGIPLGWSLEAAIAAVRQGRCRERAAIEIERLDAPGGAVRGFLFGAGAFVKGTEFAQRSHRWGAFDGVAVALALGWGVGSMMLGGAGSAWCAREPMGLRYGAGSDARGGPVPDGEAERVLMFASTLERLPVGFRPFGAPRPGLKTLVADAPRRLAASLPMLLSGSESPALARRGYHRVDTRRVEVDLSSPFILDGEHFPAGGYLLRQGAPIRFVVP